MDYTKLEIEQACILRDIWVMCQEGIDNGTLYHHSIQGMRNEGLLETANKASNKGEC